MDLEPLGPLSLDYGDTLVSAEIEVKYFPDTRLRFVVDGLQTDGAPADYAAAVREFLTLTPIHRAEAAPYVYANYRDFVAAVGEDCVDFSVAAPEDIWEHVHPSEVYVGRRFRDGKVYVSIEAECDWEQEHGLQIVYRDGSRLSYVSAQTGHLTYSDAYGLPESEDRISEVDMN